MRCLAPLVAILLFTAAPVYAAALSEQTLYSNSQVIENLNSDGDFGRAEDAPFNWNLYYGYYKTTTPNDDAPAIIDETYNYAGGVGWAGDSDYSLGLKLNYSTTPSEQLEVRGGQASVSYHWSYAKSDPNVIFVPYFTFKLIGASTNYIETYSGQIPRKKAKPKIVAGISELQQNMLGFDVNWKPIKTLRFDFEYDQFFSNRDVGNFENQLDTPTALQTGEGGFSSTVGGLASATYIAGIFWDFIPKWRLEVTEQYSVLALDSSISSTAKLTISDQFAKAWKITVGAEQQSSNALSDTLAVLGIDCEI